LRLRYIRFVKRMAAHIMVRLSDMPAMHQSQGSRSQASDNFSHFAPKIIYHPKTPTTQKAGCPIHAVPSHEWAFEQSSNRTPDFMVHQNPVVGAQATKVSENSVSRED
jgi:hypothetical protein